MLEHAGFSAQLLTHRTFQLKAQGCVFSFDPHNLAKQSSSGKRVVKPGVWVQRRTFTSNISLFVCLFLGKYELIQFIEPLKRKWPQLHFTVNVETHTSQRFSSCHPGEVLEPRLESGYESLTFTDTMTIEMIRKFSLALISLFSVSL